ncbi:hypothetical protein C7450_103278 [Chelatococcus asaccharovorans]|uniref:Uncharacterized protein n=1 Tax=Chelatococcus asaccharovorans TaxID=28210 RepID=A0A2V3UNP8_9HYPH|nr:hypothetical protein C7450_103278 [Chelatococcus asaccharovorans]
MDRGKVSAWWSTYADSDRESAEAARQPFLCKPFLCKPFLCQPFLWLSLRASEPPVPGSPLPGPFPRPPTVDPSDPLRPVLPPVEEPEPDDPDNDRPQPNPDEREPEKRMLIA